MDELVGRTLGRYRLEVAMRAGYSGQVFRAKDTESNRDVALKVFKPNPLQERIKAGLQPLLGLKHANIIEILEVAETGGQLYLVSEFVPGGSVSTLLSRYAQSNKQLELPLALSLMRQAADALSYAHNKGVIHGDVKPDNMLLSAPVSTQQLSRAYTLKLGDFLMTRLTSDTAMTQDELVVSSPAYMSPEQCQGLPSDARTDLYSFGIVLYEVMTGLLPFEVKNIGEAAIKHLYAAPRSPRELRPDLSVELEALILRLLSKNPADRYAQASEVRDALQGMLERIEPQGPPPTLIRGALEPQPTQPNIPDLPDTSDSARVTIADSFGRIVKVLPLTSAGIRVGRLEFNEARLEDDNVSRQHMRVDWNGEQAYITDLGSSNGTIMANQRLLPHTPTNWSFRGVVNVGSYWLRLESPETVSRMAVGLALDPQSEKLVLQAGSAGVVRVTVANLGRVVDHFNFTIQGVPESWVRGPAEAVQLNPGVQTAVMLTLMPPRNSTAAAGTRDIAVVATSREHPENTASAKGTLTIEPFAQSALSLKPMRRSARTKTTYTATLANNGNAKLHYALYCEEDEPQLGFKFSEPILTLEPGQSKDIPLEVTAAFKLLGGTQLRNFRVIARSSTRHITFPTVGGATSASGMTPQQIADKAAKDAQARIDAINQGAGNDALQQVENTMLGRGGVDPTKIATAAQQRLQNDAASMGRDAIKNAQDGLLEVGKKALAGRRTPQLAPIIADDAVLPGGDPMPLNAQLGHGALLPFWVPPVLLAILALLYFVLNRPPVIASFEAATTQPFLNTATPLQFEVSNARAVEMQIGTNPPVPVNAADKTFLLPGFKTSEPVKVKLIARGNFGSSTQQELTFTPRAKKPTVTEFVAIPPQLVRGQPVLLRFSVKDAEELFLDKGNGQPPVKLPKFKGTVRDAPREPRVYKLIARNGDQTTEQVLNLNVNVLPPQITGFKIGPRQVIRGQGGTILLEWKTRNAQKIEMTDIGDVGASDTAILAAPTDTKTYTLVATNAKGESTKRSLTVTVIDPPPVVVAPPPPPPVAITPPPPTPTPPPVVPPPPTPTPPPPVVPPPPTVTPPPPKPPVTPPPPKPPVTVRPPTPPVVGIRPPPTPQNPTTPTPPSNNPPTTPPSNNPPPPTPTPPTPPPGGPLMGKWYHNFGSLELVQVGNKVTATVTDALTNKTTKFEGSVDGVVMRGTTNNGQGFSWTIKDGTFNGVTADGQRWCGAKTGVALPDGCGFSGSWFAALGGKVVENNCAMKLVQTDTRIEGTYCNGTVTGRIEYKQGKIVATGEFKRRDGRSSGVIVFSMSNLESLQFQGSAQQTTQNGQPVPVKKSVEQWCGWRNGFNAPSPCLVSP